MRKYNAILSTVITLLLIDHFVFGSLYLMGANVGVAKPIINLAAILIAVHAVISTVLTIKAVRVSVGPGSYFKENFDFWLRRITGVLILVLLFIHGHVMHGHDGMTEMGFVGKLANTLFPVVVCIHLIGNVRPLLIASGIRVKRTRVIIIKEKLKEISETYKKHVYSDCGKSLSCVNACPVRIRIEDLLVNSNAVAVWKRYIKD